jgi:hypothetical protein
MCEGLDCFLNFLTKTEIEIEIEIGMLHTWFLPHLYEHGSPT